MIHKKYFKVGQKVISIWGSFGNLLFQIRASVISKWDRDSYSKVGQCLFQSGAIISKWGKYYFKVGQLLQHGAEFYFKVQQLFQSGGIILIYFKTVCVIFF